MLALQLAIDYADCLDYNDAMLNESLPPFPPSPPLPPPRHP